VVEELGAVSVSEIFRAHGEVMFRAAEQRTMLRLLDGPPAVIAAGGGWAAHEGNLVEANPHALSIYLSVTAEVAAARVGVGTERPLLAEAPAERIRQLLAHREPWYRLAGAEVAADGRPQDVAAEVAAAARRLANW
jgi:shikimate kinase